MIRILLSLGIIIKCVLCDSSSSSSTSSLDEPFQKSFKNLEHAPCVTLFHRNGRVGCGTESREIQNGELLYYDGSDDDGSSYSNNLSYMNKPYVTVLEEYHLNGDNIDTIIQSNNGMLQGILILNSSNVDYNRNKNYYSPDAQSPDGEDTPSANLWYNYDSSAYPWNAKGQELLMKDMFGVPMAYIPDSDTSDALRNYAQDSSDHKSIVAEFNYYMGPDGSDSPTCLSWKDSSNDLWSPKCLPLGGTSVWAAAGSPEFKQQYQNNNGRERKLEDSGNNRKVVLVGTGMDSTSMFHDVVPGVNSAASNILTVLMAAKLVGGLSDNTLSGLSKRIVFALFQGESYGFVGSRSFLKDVAYPGFQCNDGLEVPSVSYDENSDTACLYPLRHSLQFRNVGQIAGMLTVDQVGIPVSDGMLYAHNDGNDGTFGYFLSQVLKYTYTNDYSVSYASVESNNGNGIAMPPTPLTSLAQLSQGSVGGAVLTGYDYAFSNQLPYHSHLESEELREMNLDAIASAATIVARAAFAAAYDDGSYDSQTAAGIAKNRISALSSDDETLNELADCLFNDGNCNLLQKYSHVETVNERRRTGLNIGNPYPLGTPPNYYTDVYNGAYGQPFVQVGDYIFGAYNGEDYGKKRSDAFGIQPRLLPRAVRGLLDDFLGRGSGNFDADKAQKCSSVSDCNNVNYCKDVQGDKATCTGGGICVCSRSHYHQAVDESLEAAENMYTGYFAVKDNDDGYSAMFTEPYWSNSVGVKIYRDVGQVPGLVTLGCGVVVCAICSFVAFVVLVGLKKEKMY